jgi:hypothetical protein
VADEVVTEAEHVVTETLTVPEALESETGIHVHENNPHFFIWAAILALYMYVGYQMMIKYIEARPVNPAKVESEANDVGHFKHYTAQPYAASLWLSTTFTRQL